MTLTPLTSTGRLLAATVATAAALLIVLAWSSKAEAAFELQLDSFTHVVNDSSGSPETQAGAHPHEVITETLFQTTTDADGNTLPDGAMRNIVVELPPGFVGDPTSVPRCPASDLIGEGILTPGCTDDTQIGVLTLQTTFAGPTPMPLYNMEGSGKFPAQFAVGIPAYLNSTVKPDGSVVVTASNISTALPAYGATVELWGTPADPANDAERGHFGMCYPFDGSNGFSPCPAGTPETALLTNPTSCTGEPQVVSMRANSWQDADTWVTAETTLPALEGCDKLAFNPTVSVNPQKDAADTPSAYQIKMSIPQNNDPDGLAAAHLRDAVVTLPEGTAVNPSAADGLGACSGTEIGLGSNDPATCPDSSKIGTVELETPVLEQPMEGSIYQAEQDNNPFGSTLAMYLVMEGSGVRQKLAGEISPDENTGQLATTFTDNPQLPFEELTLNFKGGSRAPLVNPPTCGTKTTEATLTPWSAPQSGPPAEASDSFEITEGANGAPCPASLADRPFDPDMKSGVDSSVAGSSTPFTFQLKREDGHQEILSTTVTPPEGVTAKLAGIPLCSNQQANAGNCPASSQVGETIVGAGAGSSPFYIQGSDAGKVFMTGPYKGEQLGMLIQVPAKAGPFDLGMVNVRAAVAVDKRTAQLTVISDEIPQILEGIPLRVRDIRVQINRPDFTIAPTNCDPMQVGATVQGSHGKSASLTNHFQVGECASLGFAPKLNLSFGKGKKNTKPNAHPPLNAKLRFNESDSNISSVEVALPKGVLLDQERLGRICSRANYAANTCPEESVVGYAKAQTPLLDDPVEGPVYLKASDNPLPDLAADLDGQIDVDLFGMIDQKENRKGLSQIRNTFDIVPDVPVSDFQLRLDGGNDGLLVNSRNICKSKKSQKVSIDMAAHNEMTSSSKPLINSACKQLNKKKAKKLKKKAKKLQRKAKRANSPRKAKQLRKQARKLKKQARKLR